MNAPSVMRSNIQTIVLPMKILYVNFVLKQACVKTNPWVRKGLRYEVTLVYAGGRGIATRRLNFLAYHLIRLIHGEDKLIDMAEFKRD